MDYETILKKQITNKEDRKLFSYAIKDGVKFERAMSLYELYKKNKELMKNNNIVAAHHFNEDNRGKKCFENLNDDIHKAILNNKSNKLMRSVFSSKYRFLINDDTKKIFRSFAECNVDKNFFKNNISKKLAALESPEELNNALSKELHNLTNWSMYHQKKIIENENVTVVSEDSNSIIFEVNDYEACKRLGTDMWCIVREKDTFEDYRADVERIYFKYDFNVPSEFNNSMTAYIVNASGDVNDGYFKDDTIMKEQELENEGVNNFFNSYKYSDFLRRVEEKNLTESQELVFFYLHNMQNELKEHVSPESYDIEPYDIHEALQKYSYGSSSKDFYLSLLEDKEHVFKNDFNGCIDNIIKYIGTRYGNELNDVLTEILNIDSYYMKDNHLSDFIDNFNFDLSNENAILFLNKKGTNIKEDMIEYILTSNNDIDFRLRRVLEEIGDNSFSSVIINNKDSELAVNYISKNWSNKDTLLDLDTNMEKIVDLINNSKVELSNSFLDLVIKEGAERGFKVNKIEENKEKQTIDYIKKYPRKAFIKKSTIKQHNIKFNKEDSLDILKTAFFEDIREFSSYDELDVVDDILFSMNEKNINLLLSNNGILDSGAKKEFISYISEIKPNEKNKVKYNLNINKIIDISKNKEAIKKIKNTF